jgi:hypothetical protein
MARLLQCLLAASAFSPAGQAFAQATEAGAMCECGGGMLGMGGFAGALFITLVAGVALAAIAVLVAAAVFLLRKSRATPS